MISRWAIVLAFVTGSTFAQLAPLEEKFAFKGFPLGGSKEEFSQRFPDFDCKGPKSCIFMYCKSSDFTECKKRTTYGGAAMATAVAYFPDGRLEQVSISVDARVSDSIGDAITERFGPPKEDSTETIRTKAGVEYRNRTRAWERAGDHIVVLRYGASIDRGGIVIESAAYRAAANKEEAQKRKAAPKDL